MHNNDVNQAGVSGPPHILIADDSPDDARLMRIAFEKVEGPVCLEFVNRGEEVLQFLQGKESGTWPDLMLLDLKMPGLGGFEVLEWLKEHPPCDRLPVVVFSGSDQPVDINRALALGARRYLVKPHKMPELVQMVQGIYRFCRKLQSDPNQNHPLEHHGHPG